MGYLAERIPYLPITERPQIRWPGGAKLAVWVVPNVEHTEYLPPATAVMDPWPRTPHPDVREYSFHDYGNRVALWRMVELFDKYEIPPTASLNVAVLQQFPEIRDMLVAKGWGIMSHGIYNTRYLGGDMSVEQEREFYADTIETVRAHAGYDLMGMLGPAITGTVHTPDLMADAGLVYHADWIHDDQPFPIRVAGGQRFISMPYTYELNDGPLLKRAIEGPEYAAMCKAQFDRLYADSDATGRVMCLALHPFRLGQPHRIRHLEEVLSYLRGPEEVWFATGDQIARHYLDNYYDDVLARVTDTAAL